MAGFILLWLVRICSIASGIPCPLMAFEPYNAIKPTIKPPTIGTATLAVYLVYAFHFLSENPEALNLKLLTNSGFIYSTTLLLFSLECMKLRRLKQK